ncbi:MAG: CotH kinase family protein, partial [Cyclobacteriaceae bacterium]
MTKIFLILIFSFVMLMAQSQNEYVAHWETVFYNETDFRYVTNNDPNVDPNWRANGFDDSNWQVGAGGFGYGDNDDGTIVEGATSVFYRKEFNVVDKSEISAMILHIDYDDAFVAYLNGVEIARSAGLLDEYPDQSAISLVEHEALIPLGGTPNSYNVYNNLLSSILAKDTNVLAIQVHNVSSTSSDLSLSTWLSVGLRTDVERYLETPEWFRPPDVQTTLTSNLPIVVITTPDGQPITDEPKITAEMGIVNNGIGQLNNSTDAFNEYNGYIGIEFRGNSTQQFPKKPYGLETRDANGANLNVALLGMPEENDWILRASYIDHTFIRNSLANYMSRITGHWASRTRHVELILNGEYQGIYLLMEKIKRDKNRVAIAKLESHEMSGEDLTGGYIWEVSGFGENFGLYRSIVYPKITDIVPLQLSYIRDFDDQFRAKMASFTGEYKDPNTGYVKHINVQSFVDELLVQEAMRNSDAYGWSSYFNKDKNELIQAGPVWDFDQSSGNSSYPDNGIVEGWMATHPGTSLTPFFWPLLFNDLFFKYTLAN